MKITDLPKINSKINKIKKNRYLTRQEKHTLYNLKKSKSKFMSSPIELIINNKPYNFTRLNNLRGKYGIYYVDSTNKYFMKISEKIRMIQYEVICLNLLSKYEYFPNLIKYDKNYIVTEYIQDSEYLNKKNCPDNIKDIFSKILNILNIYDINHNDLLLQNILVKDNNIFIIDFGLATIGKVSKRVFERKRNDKYMVNKMLTKFMN